MPGLQAGPWWGVHERQPHINISLPLFLPPFPCLKINKISFLSHFQKSLLGELKKMKQVSLLPPCLHLNVLMCPMNLQVADTACSISQIYLTQHSTIVAHAEPPPRIVPYAAKFENCQGRRICTLRSPLRY